METGWVESQEEAESEADHDSDSDEVDEVADASKEGEESAVSSVNDCATLSDGNADGGEEEEVASVDDNAACSTGSQESSATFSTDCVRSRFCCLLAALLDWRLPSDLGMAARKKDGLKALSTAKRSESLVAVGRGWWSEVTARRNVSVVSNYD